jgi:serine/threonine-protein kinase
MALAHRGDVGAMVREGDVLAGRYRVERVLGSGGMGTVFAAREIDTGRIVALKLMNADAHDVVGRGRFLREARAAVRLKGDHVAHVIAVGHLADETPYIVMEMLEGCDLREHLRACAPLAVADAVGFVLQAAEGLAEAHANAIVHRDVKLRNLFLTECADGRALVKVLDFGVAKRLRPAAPLEPTGLTSPAEMVGSPHYMSPEQMLASMHVDPRADVWSLGVCLFELLTGALPFDGRTLPAVCAAVLEHPPRSIIGLRPDVPQGVADVLALALAKDPECRWQNVAALAEALEPFGHAADRGAADRCAHLLGLAPSTRARITSRADDSVLVTTELAQTVSVRGRTALWNSVTVVAGAAAMVIVIALAATRRSGPVRIAAGAAPLQSQSATPTPIPAPIPTVTPTPIPTLTLTPTPTRTGARHAPRVTPVAPKPRPTATSDYDRF